MCKARNQQSSNTASLARSHTHFQASEVFWYLEILHRHKADISRDAILEKKEYCHYTCVNLVAAT